LNRTFFMAMKKIITLTLLFFSILLRAQEVTVSEQVSIRDDYSYRILGDERGNVLLVRDKKTKFEVQGYDNQLRLSWEKEIELDKKSPEILEVSPLGNDFCVIYQFKQKAQPVLKIHRYSPAANLLDSTTIKVYEASFMKPAFQVVFSEDKNIVLVWYVENQNEIKVLAFDIGRMKVLWEQVFAPEDAVLQRDFVQMLVNNAGDMFFILKKDNFSSKRKAHYLEIFDCGPTTDYALRRRTVSLQGRLTYDVRFSFDNLNGELKAAGFYSTDNLARVEGFYYLNIPRHSPDHPALQFYQFDDEFVAILLEKEKVKNKGISEVSIQEIVHRMDGGIILIGEMNKEFQRGMTTTNYYSRNGFRPIKDYYYDDIFLISIHPAGDMHWRKILHKKQYSQDDAAAYSSYFLVKTPSALRVIFNDEIKQGNTVSEYVVLGNGEFTRKAVMSTERKDLSLRFRDAVQVAANEFVVPSEKRNRLKLVKVSY